MFGDLVATRGHISREGLNPLIVGLFGDALRDVWPKTCFFRGHKKTLVLSLFRSILATKSRPIYEHFFTYIGVYIGGV